VAAVRGVAVGMGGGDTHRLLLRNSFGTVADERESGRESVAKERERERERKVAIIGGGVSGLAAAYYLQKELGSHVNILLIEASNQTGLTLSLSLSFSLIPILFLGLSLPFLFKRLISHV
jgi:hypothetical protein